MEVKGTVRGTEVRQKEELPSLVGFRPIDDLYPSFPTAQLCVGSGVGRRMLPEGVSHPRKGSGSPASQAGVRITWTQMLTRLKPPPGCAALVSFRHRSRGGTGRILCVSRLTLRPGSITVKLARSQHRGQRCKISTTLLGAGANPQLHDTRIVVSGCMRRAGVALPLTF